MLSTELTSHVAENHGQEKSELSFERTKSEVSNEKESRGAHNSGLSNEIAIVTAKGNHGSIRSS